MTTTTTTTTSRSVGATAQILQTLQRGISALDLLAGEPAGLTTSEVAQRLGVHRTIASRLLFTLLVNRLLVRDHNGRYYLGLSMARYAVSVAPLIREAALPELRQLSDRYGVTAALNLADGSDVVVLDVIEPSGPGFFVGVRVGSRHPLTTGAGGLAILAGREPSAHDLPQVREARTRGYAVTRGEVNRGVTGICAAVGPQVSWAEASIGILSMASLPIENVGPDVAAAAAVIRGRIQPNPDLP